MIYTKIEIIDGLYKVKCYDENGVDTTNTFTIKSNIYILNENEEFILVAEVIGNNKQLTLDFLSREYVYITLFLNNQIYKTHLKTSIQIKTIYQKYTLTYKITTALPRMSNLLLDRFTYSMPKWSAAYINDVSNYSKLIYPFFCSVEKLYYKTSEIMDRALENKTYYRQTVTNVDVQQVSKVTDKNDKELRFSYNKTNSETSRLVYTPVQLSSLDTDLFSYTIATLPLLIKCKKYCSKIYIRSLINSTVILRGLDFNGNFITEKFVFNTLNTKTSKFSYSEISEVVSTTEDTLVSNFLDGISDHFSESFQDIPVFINKDKVVQFPRFIFESNSITAKMLSINKVVYEHHSYLLDSPINSIFITKYGDVLSLLANGNLGTSLLNKDLEVNMPLLNTNNLTKYVALDYIDKINNTASFSVDCKSIYEEFEDMSVQIIVQSDEGVYYLDGISKQLTPIVSNFTLNKHNSLKLSFDYSDTSFVSVIVKTTDKSFQASYRSDKILFKQHVKPSVSLIKTLLYINNEYLIQTVDNKIYKVNLIKDYYEVDTSGFMVLYEPDAKLTTTKGKLINV